MPVTQKVFETFVCEASVEDRRAQCQTSEIPDQTQGQT